jgi:integrase
MSVFKRNGHWYFSKTIDGVRYKGALKTARTKAQAEEAERKFLTEVHQGTYGAPKGTMAFGEYAEKYYLPWAKVNKRSWKIDICRLKALNAFFGTKRLKEISPILIESYKRIRLKTAIVSKTKTRQRSPAAVNRELCLLSKIFSRAVVDKQASHNPCGDVDLLQGERKRKRYMLPEEEPRLMEVLVGPRAHLHDLVVLAVNTGLRENELFSLKPEQVDFHRDAINVKETKGGEDRYVPMNDLARDLLYRLVTSARHDGRMYLLTNPKTGRKYTTIKTAWLTACRLAGIEDLNFHDLRHTFGTRAIDNGAPLPAVQEVMGHKSIETTLGYTHATEEGKRRVVEAVGKRVARPVPIRSQSGKRKLA